MDSPALIYWLSEIELNWTDYSGKCGLHEWNAAIKSLLWTPWCWEVRGEEAARTILSLHTQCKLFLKSLLALFFSFCSYCVHRYEQWADSMTKQYLQRKTPKQELAIVSLMKTLLLNGRESTIMVIITFSFEMLISQSVPQQLPSLILLWLFAFLKLLRIPAASSKTIVSGLPTGCKW